MREGYEVRFDKPVYIIGAAAIAAGGVLGFLAGGRPGILAAFRGPDSPGSVAGRDRSSQQK
jgi:hypothetical protein